jgi:hypothetical protein
MIFTLQKRTVRIIAGVMQKYFHEIRDFTSSMLIYIYINERCCY